MEDGSMKKSKMKFLVNRVKHILCTPLRWKDSFRLRRDRNLSRGGIRTIGIVFFFSFFVTLLIAVAIFFYYGDGFIPANIKYPEEDSFHPKNIFDAAYYLLITNGGQNLFDGPHFLGAIITSVGIFLIAFLTSALTSLLERRSERYLSGESTYRMKNHIVIFGASDYLYSIIREKTKGRETGFWNKIVAFFRPQRFLIVTTKDVKAVRREVFSFLEKGTHKKDFVFLFGERTSPEDISHLSLEYAKEVFIIGDSEESDDYESYRDANNMDCVKEIGKYLDRVAYRDIALIRTEKVKVALDDMGEPRLVKDSCWRTIILTASKAWAWLIRKDWTKTGEVEPSVKAVIQHISKHSPKPLICHVMFEYQTSFAAFQFCEPVVSARLDFRPFNYYDLWARKMLVTQGEGVYSHDYMDTIIDDKAGKKYINRDSDKTVHLIILGMSKMGIAMGIQAAQVCHYPNFKVFDKKENNKELLAKERKKVNNRTRITFIDANADIEMDYLKGRFPCLLSETRKRYADFTGSGSRQGVWEGDEKGWYDTELEFIKGRIESPQIQDYIESAAVKTSRIVTLAICLPKSHQSMAAAMYMRESVYANVLQIFTFQRNSGTIVKELAATENGRYKKKIIPFGMMECGYDSSLDDDTRAMLASYVYDSAYAHIGFGAEKEEKEDENREKTVTYSIKGISPEKNDTEFKHFQSYTDKFSVYPDYSYIWPTKSIFDRASSTYNASTIGAKLRGIGILEEDIQALTDETITRIQNSVNDNIVLLSNVEHNRWNLEKMLTGYRALNEKETTLMDELWKDANQPDLGKEEINRRKKLWSKQRGILKGYPLRAHLDICSVEALYDREDEATIKMDEELSRAIPFILKTERTLTKKHPKKQKENKANNQ